jgi:hypothetical protein
VTEHVKTGSRKKQPPHQDAYLKSRKRFQRYVYAVEKKQQKWFIGEELIKALYYRSQMAAVFYCLRAVIFLGFILEE